MSIKIYTQVIHDYLFEFINLLTHLDVVGKELYIVCIFDISTKNGFFSDLIYSILFE